eukprot:scaffold9690_cov246-Skeletonema_marinoi.AAC.1
MANYNGPSEAAITCICILTADLPSRDLYRGHQPGSGDYKQVSLKLLAMIFINLREHAGSP